jgi:hypothetical protein
MGLLLQSAIEFLDRLVRLADFDAARGADG